MKIFSHSHSALGSSHRVSGKPMQDKSSVVQFMLPDGDEADILCVSDGHGSPEHFRSNVGAGFAIEAARECLPHYFSRLRQMSKSSPVGSRGVVESDSNVDDFEAECRKMFSHINARWSSKVLKHTAANPPEQKPAFPARPYGCTLLCAAVCSDFWLAFQLGDGAFLAFDANGRVVDPIPSDSRCVGTVTTSMCLHGALDFRFAWGREVPPAIMICTDGLEKAFDSHEALADVLLGEILRTLIKNGPKFVVPDLESALPKLSEQTTHDDMSIAVRVDLQALKVLMPYIEEQNLDSLLYERSSLEAEMKYTVSKIDEIENDIARLKEDSAYESEYEIIRKDSVLSTLQRTLRRIWNDIAAVDRDINDFN